MAVVIASASHLWLLISHLLPQAQGIYYLPPCFLFCFAAALRFPCRDVKASNERSRKTHKHMRRNINSDRVQKGTSPAAVQAKRQPACAHRTLAELYSCSLSLSDTQTHKRDSMQTHVHRHHRRRSIGRSVPLHSEGEPTSEPRRSDVRLICSCRDAQVEQLWWSEEKRRDASQMCRPFLAQLK